MANFFKESFLASILILWIFYSPAPWWGTIIGVLLIVILGPIIMKLPKTTSEDPESYEPRPTDVKITMHHEGSVIFWTWYFKIFKPKKRK